MIFFVLFLFIVSLTVQADVFVVFNDSSLPLLNWRKLCEFTLRTEFNYWNPSEFCKDENNYGMGKPMFDREVFHIKGIYGCDVTRVNSPKKYNDAHYNGVMFVLVAEKDDSWYKRQIERIRKEKKLNEEPCICRESTVEENTYCPHGATYNKEHGHCYIGATILKEKPFCNQGWVYNEQDGFCYYEFIPL